MHRREFLGVLCAATITITGCLSNDSPGAAGTETSDPATATPTETMRAPTTTRSTTTRTTDTDAPVAPTDTTTVVTSAPTADDRTREGTSNRTTGDTTIQVRDTEFTVESDTPSDGGDAGGGSESDATDQVGTPDAASVAFDAAANRVVVTGTIVGENGCQTATLESARYDAQAGLFTITIATERDAPEDAICTMALVQLPYEATIAFEGGIPERVSVVHRGANTDGEVAKATRER